MARIRNPNRDIAYGMYKNNSNYSPKQIAIELDEKASNIRTWKYQDKWDKQLDIKKNKRGAPKGNENAIGNKGGAPQGNLNAFKHGERIPVERFTSKQFLAKYLPRVTNSILEELDNSGMSSLDILWANINIQFAAVLRSQKIMYVKTHNDMTKELKKTKVQNDTETDRKTGKKTPVEVYREEEYELQFAWDKQDRFIAAQSKGMQVLLNLIKTYEDLLHKNWDLATEEQKVRIEVLKSKVVKDDDPGIEDDGFIDALEGKVDRIWED